MDTHQLTEKQIRLRVEKCRKLLQIYKNCNKQRLLEIVTGDETVIN